MSILVQFLKLLLWISKKKKMQLYLCTHNLPALPHHLDSYGKVSLGEKLVTDWFDPNTDGSNHLLEWYAAPHMEPHVSKNSNKQDTKPCVLGPTKAKVSL